MRTPFVADVPAPESARAVGTFQADVPRAIPALGDAVHVVDEQVVAKIAASYVLVDAVAAAVVGASFAFEVRSRPPRRCIEPVVVVAAASVVAAAVSVQTVVLMLPAVVKKYALALDACQPPPSDALVPAHQSPVMHSTPSPSPSR